MNNKLSIMVIVVRNSLDVIYQRDFPPNIQ